MEGADITLSAPRGYCFDKRMLNPAAADGFALLPRCDRLSGGGFFASLGGSRDSAVITATLGRATKGAPAPSVRDLAASVPGAVLRDQKEDALLPLAKLDIPGHGARGASSEHWRGAFVLNGHVILLALYAPEDSPLLGAQGAMVLDDMARLTQAASVLPAAAPEPKQDLRPDPVAARRTGAGALRPMARPTGSSGPAARTKTGRDQKLSLAKRIAGLFD